MNKRQKTISGLKCCTKIDGTGYPRCERCPYADEKLKSCKDVRELMADALALLMAQEPRLLAREELQALEKGTLVYFEETDGSDCYHGYTCFKGVEGLYMVFAAFGAESNYYNAGDYGENWRCWSSKPTDKQRWEAKWDE